MHSNLLKYTGFLFYYYLIWHEIDNIKGDNRILASEKLIEISFVKVNRGL
jgi:hypothetical protein